jgi:hypothetical protein
MKAVSRSKTEKGKMDCYKTTVYLRLIIMSVLPIACSTMPYGKITGQLIGEESKKPLHGGVIVPCWIGNGTQATVILDMATVSDENGEFELPSIPPGKYILLYHPSEDFLTTRHPDLDGLSVPVAIESILNFVQYSTSDLLPRNGPKTIDPPKVLDGLKGGITLQTRSTIEYDNSGRIIGGNGSFVFPEYGLSVNYEKGRINSVKMRSRGVVDVKIKAWGL